MYLWSLREKPLSLKTCIPKNLSTLFQIWKLTVKLFFLNIETSSNKISFKYRIFFFSDFAFKYYLVFAYVSKEKLFFQLRFLFLIKNKISFEYYFQTRIFFFVIQICIFFSFRVVLLWFPTKTRESIAGRWRDGFIPFPKAFVRNWVQSQRLGYAHNT